jgi:hypothetical protein
MTRCIRPGSKIIDVDPRLVEMFTVESPGSLPVDREFDLWRRRQPFDIHILQDQAGRPQGLDPSPHEVFISFLGRSGAEN